MRKEQNRTLSVAVFLNRQSKASRDQVAGILQFAARRESWYLHILSRPDTPSELEALLKTLKPDGIIVCRKHRIAVPLQIAVLGVDNDEEVCENTVPTLSSIAPDYRAGGFKSLSAFKAILKKRTGRSIRAWRA